MNLGKSSPLPGNMHRLPLTKAGGTDVPYSSTSGLNALERSYTVPFWLWTMIPCSCTPWPLRCLLMPVGCVELDLAHTQQHVKHKVLDILKYCANISPTSITHTTREGLLLGPDANLMSGKKVPADTTWRSDAPSSSGLRCTRPQTAFHDTPNKGGKG